MAKVDRAEKLLQELSELRERGPTDEGIKRLKAALGEKAALVASRAVALAEAWNARELTPELCRAFARFVDSSDPGCAVKEAVAKALCEWGAQAGAEVFEKGVRIFQREAVWGGSVDVAAGLRGWCALGLSSLGHREQVRLVLPLLADAEVHARIMGVRALGQGGSEAGEALLRLKAVQGDPEETVTAECLTALAAEWPERSVAFLEELAKKDEPIGRLARFALAECRSDRAWQSLVDMFDAEFLPEKKRELLDAMATARSPKALSWMLDLIENGPVGSAVEAVVAMGVRREHPSVWDRVVAAAEASGNPRIQAAMERRE